MHRPLIGVLLLAFLAACASEPAASIPALPTAQVVVLPFQSPTPVPTPTATPTLDEYIQPYTVAGLRAHRFEGGNVTLLSQVEKNDVFTRYRIAYPSDGLTITGILQIPAEGRPPFPVIVMNHGYFNRGDYHSGDGTDRAAEFLNRRGYLTISSDYRSWGDSDVGPSLFYTGLAIDVVNLLHAIPSIPQADAERIGIWGHSMGGGVTMKVLMLDTPVRAAVLYSTVSADDADVIKRWGPGCIGDIAAGEKLYGCNSSDVLPADLPRGLIDAYIAAAANPALLQDVSPYYHLRLVRVPLQINYGTEDGQVISGTPPDWSRKLYDGLVEAGATAELFAYEGQGHSFASDAWFAFMERSARFYDRVLNDTP